TYTTPIGFTLPSSGTVAGGYTWTAIYSGDNNNDGAKDQNTIDEQTAVRPAGRPLVTTAIPSTVMLGTSPVTLTDSATLAGGYHPTGTIIYTLVAPGGATVHTEPVTVNGNGTYTTPTGFTLPSSGTVTGTYTWTATYEGDANNDGAKDQGSIAEQTVV